MKPIASWVASLLLSGLSLLVSCGMPGEPLPPLLNLPARVTDLEATQRAGELLLAWTVPSETSEGFPLRDLDRVVIWSLSESSRHELAALQRRSALGQRTELRLPLPASAGQRVALAVESFTRRGRSAGLSNVVVIEIAAAPAAPSALRATAQPEWIRLEWPAVDGATGYRLYRSVNGKPAFTPLGEIAAPPFDDPDFRWGIRYAYFVRALIATSTGAAESADSPRAELIPEDRFPPAPPAGLQAVATEATVELSWLPSPDPDTAGYHVYRRTAGDWIRLTSEPVSIPAFSDKDARREPKYSYAVSALDSKGNESPRSPSLEVILP